MRTIDTEIAIAAPASAVWRILTTFADHARWNPFFESITGDLTVGARLVVSFRNGFTMKPRITELHDGQSGDAGHVLEWLGSLGFRGIFDGRHRFEIVPTATGCTLHHRERFTGILVPFTGRLLAETARGFEAFNAAIKTEAEGAWAKSAA
jgi:hypothetical protein